jgi:hypothetical protein
MWKYVSLSNRSLFSFEWSRSHNVPHWYVYTCVWHAGKNLEIEKNGAYHSFLTAFFVASVGYWVKNSLFLHLLWKKRWKFAIISAGKFEDLTGGDAEYSSLLGCDVVPTFRSNVLLTERRVPLAWRRVPLAWRRVLFSWRRVTLAWRRVPLAWRRVPLAWRRVPLA